VLLSTPLHQHIGLRAADLSDPSQGLVLMVEPQVLNNSELMHGGMVATCLDAVAAYAIFPQLADNEVVLTNSLTISYLRPVPVGTQIWARAKVVRRGRATAFLQSEVGMGDKLIATAQIVKTIVTITDED
jgi:uncharacterized protein (TIGR00369 family)